MDNSIIYDARALEKARANSASVLGKQGNQLYISEVNNGKCRKKEKEENK